MLHYYPRHISSINMSIFRRKNFIHTTSGIVALCKRLHSTLVESGLQSALNQCTGFSTNTQISNVMKIRPKVTEWFHAEDRHELFHQPTLMHNFLYSLTICLLHYYPRRVSSINMPIFRRKNCIHIIWLTIRITARLLCSRL